MTPQADLEKMARIYEGILILGCLPNSPAASNGLRYGDILTEVNGVRTTSLSAFFRARSLNRESMTLCVIRDGSHLQMRLTLNSNRKANLEEVRALLGVQKNGEPPPDTVN